MNPIRKDDDHRVGRRERLGVTVPVLVGGAVILLGLLFALLLLLGARPAAAQGLADFDYEDLTLRGVMVDAGYIFPDRVEETGSIGVRLDLGYLGPGVRVTTGLSRWSSFLVREEVRKLEARMEELVLEQTGESVTIDLDEISWSDVALNADAHLVWRVPLDLLTYAGLGVSAHVLRGGGRAIEDTFVEDLLNSVRAGLNVHSGVELPVHPRLRFVGEARYEFVENLRYLQLRVGGQFMFRPAG